MKQSTLGRPRALYAAIFAIFFSLALGVTAADPRAQAALAANPNLDAIPGSILVRFEANVPAVDRAAARAAVGAKLERAFSLVPDLELLSVDARRFPQALKQLQQHPRVLYAEPDYVVRSNAKPNDTYYGLQWGLNNTGQTINGVAGVAGADVRAQLAWDTTTGSSSFIVAVLDTGVQYTHPDLKANMWRNDPEYYGTAGVDDDGNGFVDDIYGWDFYAGNNDPNDEHGHGTHVAGVIGAVTDNGTGIAGLNWQVKIMPLRFLGPNGGTVSDAISALGYAVKMGARVSNNSWGGTGYSQSLYDAIRNSAASNHLFIAAAGNDGLNTDSSGHYPSGFNLDNIISVAATTNRDGLATFSNYGVTTVDLGAPGVDIASTYTGSNYAYMSGTSMAAPFVSGVAAMVYAQRDGWGYAKVANRLLTTTRPLAALNGKTVTGGILNAAAAVEIEAEPTAPAAPSNLIATADSTSQITLTWSDNANDEDGFQLERSLDATAWSLIATLASNSVTYADAGLAADTTYAYRVRAYNSVGASAWSGIASATTDPEATSTDPAIVDQVAIGEQSVVGSVSGTYVDTHARDGKRQAIQERESGGRPASRYSYLEHVWNFNVTSGNLVTFYLNAYMDASTDGDTFSFEYSRNGSSYTPMVIVDNTSVSSVYQSYVLPATTNGTVYVRVVDTDRTSGNRSLDTIYVDHMFIRSESEAGDPPAAPANLQAIAANATRIDLSWDDLSTDEFGFEIARSLDRQSWTMIASVEANVVTYADTTVSPATTYVYRVRAFNGSGASAWSATASATTPDGISLQATAYKVKGAQTVDLSWSGATTSTVYIYRDGTLLTETANDGAYTDNIGGKGGGTYTYQLCEPAGGCSNSVTITF